MNPRREQNPVVRPVPTQLADVALLDINDLRAAVRMSASWVLEEVRSGRFPAPVIRQSRCTRWRASDVRDYLIKRAQTVDIAAAETVTARAKKASAAAQVKRVAAAAEQ